MTTPSATLRRAWLFAPMAVLLGLFVLSVFQLAWSSFAIGGFKLYGEIVADPIIQRVLVRTVLIALATTVVSALLAYPLALFLSRSPNRNIWLILVISPWLVSIVVRTFGWMVLLGNRGAVNSFAVWIGLLSEPVRILYSPGAVVLGLAHVFIPFVVIAILSSLLQQDRRLEEAGRILGGTRWQTFSRITLPLSVPGVVNGCSLVLLMSTGAIVTPLLLGGIRDRMVGTQIYTEIFSVFSFERASAISIILLVVALALVLPLRLFEARLRKMQGLE